MTGNLQNLYDLATSKIYVMGNLQNLYDWQPPKSLRRPTSKKFMTGNLQNFMMGTLQKYITGTLQLYNAQPPN